MDNQQCPLVTFVVPCYNSAAYMTRAIDSLLAAHRPCEILLINDGSSDNTSQIAHAYDEKYEHVHAIDQPNANWGGVINHGLSLARGRFFKVVDSDDYIEPLALKMVLDALAQLIEDDDAPDLLITNYLYDHLASGTKRTMRYRSFFPVGRTFTWSEMGRPGIDTYIMIHATWYATSILRESDVQLRTGVPYMDSLLLLHPMPFVKKLYYLDVSPYWYAIGREGQSIDAAVIKKHADDQLLASNLAIDDTDYAALFEREPNCATLMTGYMQCMMSVSTYNLFTIGTPEAIAKNTELWAHLRQQNPVLYQKVRWSWAGIANRRTKLGRLLSIYCYRIGQRFYKLI